MIPKLQQEKSKEWVEGFAACFDLINKKYQRTDHFNLAVMNTKLQQQVDDLDEKVMHQTKELAILKRDVFIPRVGVREFTEGNIKFYTNAPDEYVQEAQIASTIKTPINHPDYDKNRANLIVQHINNKTPYKANLKAKYVI
jgi:hypothetical protein